MRNSPWRLLESMKTANIDLSISIRRFAVHNRTEGKSPQTVGCYNEVLGLLHRWLIDEQRSTVLPYLDEMVIREFILDLQGRPRLQRRRDVLHIPSTTG